MALLPAGSQPDGAGSLVEVFFFDFEGTLNDTAAAGRAYAVDLATYMARQHPGHQADWPAAVVAGMRATRAMQGAAGQQDWQGYAEYRRRELRAWVEALLESAGLAVPGAAGLDELARQISSQVQLSYVPTPGAVECLSVLQATSCRLYVTSGADSAYTTACLEGAGLAGAFAGILGPDRVGVLKTGPAYYEQCLAFAGASAATACVVDDSPGPLEWALELGCRAIGVGPAAAQLPRHDALITLGNLGQLPAVLKILNK